MTGRTTAALARFAAICGFLLAPSAAATAQLRCANTEADTLIRKVSFEGNETFSDEELAFHVVSTETDVSRRWLANRKLVIGAGGAAGLLIGLRASEITPLNTGLWTASGLLLGYGISRISGVARCLGRGTLAGDILNLSGFYRDEGFRDVRVDTATRVDGHRVDILFRVTEGRPVLVESLSIVGFDTASLGPLPTSLNSRKGGRYSPTLTQEDVDTLETRLHDNGYPEGRVDRSVDLPTTYGANVEFRVTPGIKARIGEIRINHSALEGRDTSIEEGVIRSLLRFRSGDLYSERVLFEAGRRFYAAGAFVTAEVAPDLRRLASDSVVDVNVFVVEDLMHSGDLEQAVGTLDCLRMRGVYGDKAFLGGVNRLDVNLSVSKIGLAAGTRMKGLYDFCRRLQPTNADTNEISSREVNYNASVRLTRPIPLPGGLLPSVSAYTERRGGYNAYLRTTLIGGAVTLTKGITRSVVFEGSYNLEFGHTEAAETVLCFLFRACDQSARDQLTQGDKRLAVLGAKFSRDRRNSADSASAGTFIRLDLRSSNRLFLSDPSIEFRKGTIDAAWYTRLGVGVLAVRARAGLMGGGQRTGGARLAPPQERLYVGGETSVRGFRQNELGPLIYVTSDTGPNLRAALDATTDEERIAALQQLDMRIIPAGGAAMYVGNLEYRVRSPFLKTLQLVLFVDGGALRTPGVTTTVTGSNQFRITPGLAVKYFSPVGPIQVNLGYNRYDLLDGPAFSDQGSTLQCLTGTDAQQACRPLPAIAPLPGSWYRRLTLSVAFPPDF